MTPHYAQQWSEVANEDLATSEGIYPAVDWSDLQKNRATRPEHFQQAAIYPEDSILDDFVKFGISQSEGAEAFIIGSILPVVAAMLGRKVFFQWGAQRIYSNIYSMLAGRAGDRKSSTINLAHVLARRCLPANAFIPQCFSPETLFDEYYELHAGRPDKIWIVDDANIIMTDWCKTGNGERNATRFLTLYDCGPLSESYRRNKTETDPETRRTVPETSTSILFGATFNIARFQGHQIRAGLARRFLYYVAEAHGRVIVRPKVMETPHLYDLFCTLNNLDGEIDFSPDAAEVWEKFQNQNRKTHDETDRMQDAELSRLSSAPMQTLKIAMLFECARAAKIESLTVAPIQQSTLEKAIAHVEECMRGARFLESLADRASIASKAEVLLAMIQQSAHPQPPGETIYLTRSQITSKYAPHSGRAGALTPEDLYQRIIPYLISQGVAQRVVKKGKLEVYAFKVTQE
jgi:hypothetical protein